MILSALLARTALLAACLGWRRMAARLYLASARAEYRSVSECGPWQ